MSFDHKAFSFDWVTFRGELAPTLNAALSSGEGSTLAGFVEAHLNACRSPYDGSDLGRDWRDDLQTGDVQELADFALTKYYDPAADRGVSDAWGELDEELPEDARKALLGSRFGPSQGAPFDPGRMGAYFQRPDEVSTSLTILENLEHDELGDFVDFLREVVRAQRGLYVTF